MSTVLLLVKCFVILKCTHAGCVLVRDMFCMFFACRRREYSRFHGCTPRDTDGMWRKIPWMHAARHGWDVEKDAPLFRNWAIHTGAVSMNTDTCQHKHTHTD